MPPADNSISVKIKRVRRRGQTGRAGCMAARILIRQVFPLIVVVVSRAELPAGLAGAAQAEAHRQQEEKA